MNKVLPHSLFSDFDIELFSAGKHYRLFEKFGAHQIERKGISGLYFAVYAPAAREVRVIGDFNYWDGQDHILSVRWDGSGIWEGFIPDLQIGCLYKYQILSHHDEKVREKADPYSRYYEVPPKTASSFWDDQYSWQDANWMKSRSDKNALDKPYAVYEMHIGSWKKSEDGKRSLSYRELASELVDYVKSMHYTHVEFLPVMEHPYYPSWGYLCTGYFAPTSRFGTPEDFKYLVDQLHQNDIGVILDWVPAHFPSDEFALADFDGTCLYEHPDKAKGFHPDWNSLIFNYERAQIRSFLISSAHFWLYEFHIDGLRVDAVASMLYLDYSREEGEWSPNEFGGNEYLAASNFLKELNASVYQSFPGIHMIAEESTAFDGVTRPVDHNGLGFGLKWMMGWMNDSLEFFSRDPIHRSHHHYDISRSLTYAFTENYILPLSHDEVVHGKRSLIYKMPGDEWQRFANMRLLFLLMYTHPGQKLLFMGADFGQTEEWNVDKSLDWHLLNFDCHKGLQKFVSALNLLYKNQTSLYENNYRDNGFEWIDFHDNQNSVISFIRKSQKEYLIIVCNFVPEIKENYRVGVPELCEYEELMNSDDASYFGSHVKNDFIKSVEIPWQGRPHSINVSLPPLGGIILKKKTS